MQLGQVGVGLVERVPAAVVRQADHLDGGVVVAHADQAVRPVAVLTVAVLVDVVAEV